MIFFSIFLVFLKIFLNIFLKVLSFNVLFNDLILSHVYMILPLIYIYHIWIRITVFIKDLNIMYDSAAHDLIHLKMYKHLDYFIFDELGGAPLSRDGLRRIYLYYIQTDFVYNREGDENDGKSYYRINKKKSSIIEKVYRQYYKIKNKLKEVFIDPIKS